MKGENHISPMWCFILSCILSGEECRPAHPLIPLAVTTITPAQAPPAPLAPCLPRLLIAMPAPPSCVLALSRSQAVGWVSILSLSSSAPFLPSLLIAVTGSMLSGTRSIAPASAHCRPPSSPPHMLRWRGVIGSLPGSALVVRPSHDGHRIWALCHQVRPSHAPPMIHLWQARCRLCGRCLSLWWRLRALSRPQPWHRQSNPHPPTGHRIDALSSWWCRSSAIFAHPGHRRAGASCEHRGAPVPLVPCAGASPLPTASVAFIDLLPTRGGR
jgi:hypothetical protein